MPTAKRSLLRQELCQRLYPTEDVLVSSAPLDAAGTTSTLIDAVDLISTMLSNNNLVGAWLLITKHSTAVAPEGEARRIISYNAATGTVTVDPAFTAAPQTGANSVTEYEIHYAINPERINEAISWALTVGTNWAYPDFSTASWVAADDTALAIPDKDIVIEGALFRIKQTLARRAKGELRQEITQQAEAHRQAYYRGLELLGYRKPFQAQAMNEQQRLARI